MVIRDRGTRPTAQIGFIKYVLLPLFEALNNVTFSIICIGTLSCYLFQLYPEMEDIAVGNLRSALAYYEKKKDTEERKKKLLTEPAPEADDHGMETA